VISRLSDSHMVEGLKVSLRSCPDCPPFCDSCVRGNQAQPHMPTRQERAERPLQRVHADTVGTLPVTALDGCRYFLTVVDEAFGYCAAVPVKTKAEKPGKFKRLLVRW
jgi:hypothetical protein